MNIADTGVTDIITLTNYNIEKYIPVETDKDGVQFLNLMSTIHIPLDINPVYYDMYTPFENETFQTISYKHYGTIKLWWLICATNFIFDTTNGAVGGIPIKIIKKEYVQSILNSIEQPAS